MIKFINIDKIYPHPDNPRKELGDLTELAESIKVSGVLQNLTLVPRDIDTYTVIIGHRRLAAAKLAGLTELPCVVTNMSDKEQAATMLVENMQRNDLTIYEQAQGFQLMLDLGETVDTLAQKTGFSGSTIRRRIKLLDLDKDKFRAAEKRGATLDDYLKLDKIKSSELKNEVLGKIGTSNFRWALKRAIDEERAQERQAVILEAVQKFAVEADRTKTANMKFYKAYYNSGAGEIEQPDDAGKVKYSYIPLSYGVEIYRPYTKDEKRRSVEENRKAAERKRISNQFAEIAERAFELRRKFVRRLNAKQHKEIIMQFAIKSFTDNQNYYIQIVTPDEFYQFYEADEVKRDGFFDGLANGDGNLPTEKALFIIAYCRYHDNEHNKYSDFDNKHCNNLKLDALYEYLESLGYEMSDEERAWQNGTHELYSK